MIDYELEIEINSPVPDVFRYVCSPENFPEWATYVETARRSPAGPLAVGSLMIYSTRGREVVWTLTAFEPDALCRYEADYFYATGSFTFRTRPTAAGTLFSVHDEGTRSGWMRLVSPVLDRLEPGIRLRQMREIKRIIEENNSG